jgi:hypothetical protein
MTHRSVPPASKAVQTSPRRKSPTTWGMKENSSGRTLSAVARRGRRIQVAAQDARTEGAITCDMARNRMAAAKITANTPAKIIVVAIILAIRREIGRALRPQWRQEPVIADSP